LDIILVEMDAGGKDEQTDIKRNAGRISALPSTR
jgi:hypothetical protein